VQVRIVALFVALADSHALGRPARGEQGAMNTSKARRLLCGLIVVGSIWLALVALGVVVFVLPAHPAVAAAEAGPIAARSGQAAPPTVSFDASPRSCCAPLTVHFTDTSTDGDGIASWWWDLGDGETATTANPSHVYTSPGYYTVTLTATNTFLYSATLTRTSYITVHGVTALWTAGQVAGCGWLTWYLTSTATATPGPVAGWFWDFGDGSSSHDQNPTHTYTLSGTCQSAVFSITHLVTDSHGCTSTIVRAHRLYSYCPITASFEASPSPGCTGMTVYFTDTSTTPDYIVEWWWDLGDGSSASTATPSHTYTTFGSYTVTLTVTNEVHCSSTVTRPDYVTIDREGPGCTVTVLAPPVCASASGYTASVASAGQGAAYTWSVQDGYIITGQNTPSISWGVPDGLGLYTVTVAVTSANGCSCLGAATVNMIAPQARFERRPRMGCPLTMFFLDTSTTDSGTIVGWFWEFGDGSSSHDQNPSHTYTITGEFVATLVVTDSQGCTGTMVDPEPVVVYAPPTASFDASPTSGCAPLTTYFTDTSAPDVDSIAYRRWDFGDGGTATTANASHTYETGGYYTVTLTVTNPTGCADAVTRTNTITVHGVTALWHVSQQGDCGLYTYSFTSTATATPGPLAGWFWDFGDGSSSHDQNPTHTYTVSGTCRSQVVIITHVVTDSYGCTSTSDRAILQRSYCPVTASFEASPYSGCTGMTMQFTDTSTTAADGIAAWWWDLGDGGTATTANPWHGYASVGSYTVTLTVTNTAGCSDIVTQADYVTIDRQGPVCAVTVLAPILCASEGGYTASVASAGDGATYAWSVQDGLVITGQNTPSIRWGDPDAAGPYTVTLTVTDVAGCSCQGAATVTVCAPWFREVSLSSGCVPHTVYFSDPTETNCGNIVAWSWDFGDGSGSHDQNPTHTYTVGNRSYDVTLQVTDSHGCTYSGRLGSVEVYAPPTASFDASAQPVCAPATVYFTDTSTAGYGSIAQRWWDFGDGGTATTANASHLYDTGGYYTVTLTVTNVAGCFDTVTRTNHITANAVTSSWSSTRVGGCGVYPYQFTSMATAAPGSVAGWFWDFGDGSSSHDQNPTHTYTISGTCQSAVIGITHLVTDSHGCTSTRDEAILQRSYCPITASLDASPSSGCSGMTVYFTDTSTTAAGGISAWWWEFGDGGSASTANPSHTYATVGSYTVTLTATNTAGCSDSVTRPEYVTVDREGPVCTVTVLATPVCASAGGYTASVASAGQGAAYTWSVQDGYIIAGQNTPSISWWRSYDPPGLLTVTVAVTNATGCSCQGAAALTVIPPTRARFEPHEVDGCTPLTVYFSDTSTTLSGTIVGWFWDFGDGSSSHDQNPSHTYTTSDLFWVTHVVTDSQGCADATEAVPVVIAYLPPTASFDASPTSGCAPLTVYFTDTSTTGVDSIAYRRWDFGDGGTATTANPSHTYETGGYYTVTLTVTDPTGCADAVTRADFITVHAASATWRAAQVGGCGLYTYSFTSTATATLGTVAGWFWDFGDGSSSHDQNPTHTYTVGGRCEARLVRITHLVTDTYGCTATRDEQTIQWGDCPTTASFDASPSSGCTPMTVYFTDTSTTDGGGISAWLWEFGDGSVGATPNLTHSYALEGQYAVTLRVTNTYGCADQISRTALISASNCVPACVGNLVWNDLNGDGIQDAGEPGIPGISVTLYYAGPDTSPGTPDDVKIGSVTTNAGGWYTFCNLSGSVLYYLQVQPPPGYAVSPINATASDKDSDLNAITLRTAAFSMVAGGSDPDWDAGLYLLLAGLKYRPHGDVCATYTFWYYIYITNTAAVTIDGILITDVLPYGIAPYSVQTGFGYPYAGWPGGSFDGANTCTWSVPSLGPGASAAVWVRARTYSWADGMCLYNTALIAAGSVAVPLSVSDRFCVPACFRPLPAITPTPIPTPTPPLPGTVATIERGALGEVWDTYMYRYAPQINYGTLPLLRVGYKQTHAALLGFDLAPLPAGATIDDARLQVYAVGWGGADIAIGAYAVLRPWAESEATWASAQTGTPWAEPGGNDTIADRRADPEDALVTAGPLCWYSLNLTALVQEWVDGTLPNHGLLLRAGYAPMSFFLASSEYSNAALHPRLVVRYH